MSYIFDATGKKLGRLASEIALILQGKKSPKYEANKVANDRVLVKNVSKIEIPALRAKSKIYYRHTGYMGHLKSKTLEERFKKSPVELFRFSVEHMLPKNASRKLKLRRLTITA